MKSRSLFILVFTAVLGFSQVAGAVLIDRGGGLIYDDVLDVTWLQDANYAQTSGYDSDGRMIWRDAVDWAENLSYFDSVRNVTYDDWRLPTVQPIDGTGFDYDFSPAGNTDRGYNISAPGTAYTSSTGSELAYMFHVNLGNLSAYDTSGVFRGGASGTDWGVVNTGLFLNLQNFVYWSGTEYAPYTNLAWRFYAYDGLQYAYGKDFAYHAWAVRSGDVAAPPSIPELRSLVGITATPSIPEPGSLMLVGLGLVGLGWTRRRRFDHLGEFPLKG